MCGIAGFFGDLPNSDQPARQVLSRMISAIHHRGPDETGLHLETGVGLAHVRLSIIDLATGQQPMANEDQSVWVTFNGEIFNYVELQKDLIARGHTLRTHSDTETIVHLYEDRGPACVESFNGDFAFALWDKRNHRLMLARDRMGVRPLYWTKVGSTLVFASEVKALLQFPGVRAEIDPIALDQCFTFWFPLAPRTIFKNIHELPPAHVLIASGDSINIRPYWQLRFPLVAEHRAYTRDEHEVADELRELLVDATRIRLRADVPVGAYLSGGLDSSITTALIRQFTSNRLCTFSVGFENGDFDETEHQQQMVKALGTEHRSVRIASHEIGRMFPQVIYHGERPVIRTAPAPMMRLAGLVRDSGFKVVLTGEGADEVFAGYDIFKEAKLRRFWSRQPQSRRRPLLLQKLYPYLNGLHAQPQAYLQAFFRGGIEHPDHPFFSHLPRWLMTARLKVFFSESLRQELGRYDAIDDLRSQLPYEFSHWHPLSQAQYLESVYLLPQYILSSQGDRMAMAHAVEGRFPFLDHRVVEFAAALPPRMKLRGLREKHILRLSMARRLPVSIVNRPKQPYRAPDSESFFAPQPLDYVQDLLSAPALAATGVFESRAVARLVDKCRLGEARGLRENMAFVGILSVQLLDKMFVHNAAAGECTTSVPERSGVEVLPDAW